MKKKYGIRIGICIATVLLTACAKPAGESRKTDRPPQEQIISCTAIMPEKEKNYPTIAALMAETEDVIYAEITKVRYEHSEHGSIYTATTWKVLEDIIGDFQEGDTVEVYKDGGYMTVKERIDSYETEEMRKAAKEEALKEMTEEELSQRYSGYFMEGDSDPMIGDRSVLFLKKGWSPSFPNDYVRIGGSEGEYIQVKDGSFCSTGNLPSDQIRSLIEGGAELPDGAPLPDFYSLDEIKTMISTLSIPIKE